MKLIAVFLSFFAITSLQAQVITTFAGNGVLGASGNGGPAVAAQLSNQQDICSDNSGNIYIADYANHVIRKVNTAGIISIYAGTGIIGNSGDGGPATAAALSYPYGVCTDNNGNMYVADMGNNNIRKINSAGIISTVAGTGSFGISGDGIPALGAALFGPDGICADNAGNIYFAEFGNQKVRKISSTGILSTIAGTGFYGWMGDGGPAVDAHLSSPTDVCMDNAGNFYIADVGNSRVRKVNTAGIISGFAGAIPGYTGDGGPAAIAGLSFPYFVYADNDGNVYISDTQNHVVRMVNSAGIITTIAGNGTSGYSGDGGAPTAAQLITPAGICKDNLGSVYISDGSANVVRRIGPCPLAVVSQAPAGTGICAGGDVTFSITAANQSSYQWQVNNGSGWTNLVNNAVYANTDASTLSITAADASMNNYQYRCAAINTCGTLFSPAAILTVSTPAAPAISIAALSNTVCAGGTATFTATPVNSGATPFYQWKKNGINAGTNNPVYTESNLINGDVVTCDLTSGNSCAAAITIASNSITVTVVDLQTPSVTITADQNNVCYGTNVTFSTVTTNAGVSPSFQWKKNGVITGSNSSAYTDNALKSNDVITCVLTSGNSCLTAAAVGSNTIVMDIIPLINASVTISTGNTSICPGATATYLATPVNEGNLPVYQWTKNGIATGANQAVYSDNNVVNGDVITCTLTSDMNCVIGTATSNQLVVSVYQPPVVSLDHTTTLCAGAARLLDAGNFNSYLWNDGTSAKNLLVNAPGTYYVTVTDNNNCKGTDTVHIVSIVDPPANFLPADTAVCAYGSISLTVKQSYKSYNWSENTNTASVKITKPGIYWLQVTDNNNCRGTDSILVVSKECQKGFFAPTAFSPNNDGTNDYFKPLLFGTVKSYKLIIYNRWGQIVFQSTDANKGWDGSIAGTRQDDNVYAWTCSYQFEGEMQEYKKGTVIMIR